MTPEHGIHFAHKRLIKELVENALLLQSAPENSAILEVLYGKEGLVLVR